MKNIIQAPNDARYLSDFLPELPKGIFNKKQTNVGGTYFALTTPSNYIVIVPTQELIKNKTGNQSGSPYPIFGVYAGVENSTFREYIKSNNIHKIMVTYDSLGKVIKWLSVLNIDAYSYNALLDEYHLTLLAMGYRDKALTLMLKEITKFSHYTLMSATPIQDEFIPTILKELDYTEIKWNNSIKLIPTKIPSSNPYAVASRIIKQYKNEGAFFLDESGTRHESKEAFFFLNSVKGIKAIIDKTGLQPSEVKIVCSDTIRNNQILGDSFQIVGSLAPNKPFTFITSKAFEGSDFFSQTGVVYVVSDAKRKHTLIDIQTQLYQCAGRIRTETNPFRTKLFHIYSTGYVNQTKEDFEVEQQNRIDRALLIIKDLNNKNTIERLAYKELLALDLESSYLYYDEENDKYFYNEMKAKYAEFAYSLTNSVYKNGLELRSAYKKAGIDSDNQISFKLDKSDEAFVASVSTSSFKSLLLQYFNLRDTELFEGLSNNPDSTTIDLIKRFDYEYPLFKQIYEKLSRSEIETCKYVEKNIRDALFIKSNSVQLLVRQRILTAFKLDTFYSRKEAKRLLLNINKELGIKATAKATDLGKYFDIHEKAESLDGKRTDGLRLLRQK